MLLLRLSLIAVLVAWYQLPVMLERSADIQTATLSEPLHAGLSGIISAVGGPVVALRNSVEHLKSSAEATILRADWSVSPAQAAAPDVVRATAPATVPVGPPVASPSATAAGTPATPPATPAVSTAENRHASSPDVTSSAQTGAPGASSIFQQPKTVVLMGDSVMGEIFFSFKRWSSKNTAWKAIDGHKSSSGLSNTEYYDWPKVAGDLVSSYKPDIVILTLGPNDAQDIVLDKHWLHFGTDAWKAEYTARMKHLVDVAGQGGAHVYWLDVPVMRDAGFEHKMAIVRAVQAQALAGLTNVTVVNATASFADAHGDYEQKETLNGHTHELRANDGIHLAPAGADIVVAAAVAAIAPTH